MRELLNKKPSESFTPEEEDALIKFLDKEIMKTLMNNDYYDLLEAQSIVLQNRVALMLKHLLFNPVTSDKNLLKAVHYFQQEDGNINQKAPCDFLSKEDKDKLVKENGQFRVSLYKALLFIKIADAIKAGTLNLTSSYLYLSLDEYLIHKENWKNNAAAWMKQAGLEHLLSFTEVLKPLKKALHQQYCKTNNDVNSGQNAYIHFNKEGKFIIKTPKVDKEESQRVAELLPQQQYISILDVLSDVDKATHFSDALKHYSIRDKKKRPTVSLFYAGLLGTGCNIGIHKLASTSKGVSETMLDNVITWYFSNDNILAANQRILNLVNQLVLPNLFKRHPHQLHTSSDGKKRVVNAESLIANYSFKYLGSDQGVSIYDFVDERHLLFHSHVISSSEREAHYVIDALLNNEEIKSDIHSTDTHGYTDIIFAIMHLLGLSFAPRLAKIKNRTLYSFKSKKTYLAKNYKILPKKTINVASIEAHWDDILRLIVSIKLKETTASQVFKRLSSYSKNHPLYKALQEFGRIIKSLFLLTYMDDVSLRQAIQKQLNKIELSNKFSDAVFFANNQEFKQGSKEEQEIAMNCRMLIQNAIVLWNYLYLSQRLANAPNQQQQTEWLEIIKKTQCASFLPRLNQILKTQQKRKPRCELKLSCQF